MFANLTIGLVAFLFVFDFQNLLSLWRGWVVEPVGEASDDYTVVIPVYGHPMYFADRCRLEHLKSAVLVSMDTASTLMQNFASELEADGWRVFRTAVENPNPPKLFAAALPHVTTSYVVRMDADTVVGPELANGITGCSAQGVDLASVNVRVLEPRRLVERLQACEYKMAMQSRHFRPWLSSGACIVFRREAAVQIFAHHSMWSPGEDIETGRVAHALKMKIRHLNVLAFTAAPGSFGALFRQRRLWWAGGFRHTVVNFDRNVLHVPVYTFYYIALVWVGWTLHWISLANPHVFLDDLRVLPMVYVTYVSVTYIANIRVANRWFFLMPFYCVWQGALMPLVGPIWFVKRARAQHGLGRYRFGYRRRRLSDSDVAVVTAV